jgi:hypothetical protein
MAFSIRDDGVSVSTHYRRIAAVLASATLLAACSGAADLTTSPWFAKPLNVFGTSGGYNYSQLEETRLAEKPVTANDMVDANGACPGRPAPPPAAGGDQAGASDLGTLLGAGVAIGMTECDVVARVGAPNSVNLGRTPGGERSAVLTVSGGPRPGIYRFTGGRLAEMDRVAEPAPVIGETAPAKKKPEKKKLVKKKPPTSSAQNAAPGQGGAPAWPSPSGGAPAQAPPAWPTPGKS